MDKKISQLTAASTPLLGTESLPLVQSGVTKKATVQDVLGYVVNDSTNSVLKTVYSASDVGLKLDFVNENYYLGNLTNHFLQIDGSSGDTILQCSNSWNLIADINCVLTADPQVIKSTYLGNDIGLKLDFANQSYKFGSTNNDYGLIVDALNGTIQLGDIAGWYGGGIYFNIDNLNNFLSVQTGGVDVGLKLDFANSDYTFGYTGDFGWNISNGGTCGFYINTAGDWSGLVVNFDFPYTGSLQSVIIGDQASLGNGSIFGVNDIDEKLVASANLLSNTAGGSSGQHLKIKVGGTDYKIALLNP